jgi:hypothetical protein
VGIGTAPKGRGGVGSHRPASTVPNASGMNRFSSEPVGPSVFLVSWISAVALVSAETMNHYAGNVVTFGARCAEVQVSVHSSTPKIPRQGERPTNPKVRWPFLTDHLPTALTAKPHQSLNDPFWMDARAWGWFVESGNSPAPDTVTQVNDEPPDQRRNTPESRGLRAWSPMRHDFNTGHQGDRRPAVGQEPPIS